jgi:branched-chain amino acid transport system ATP-binding protein
MTERGLAVRDLSVSFGAAQILHGVSFDVKPGGVTALVGPNGAGKTTLLRAICGLVPARTGTVALAGTSLRLDPVVAARRGIAHVPEGRGLISGLTVTQNLSLASVALGRKTRAEEFERVVEVFPRLKELASRRAGLLSGGEQQMTAIARGLIVRPAVLMVDEMSLGLAPKIVGELIGTLARLARELDIGMLLVDQNVRALSTVADRMYVLNGGRLSLVGAGDENVIRTVYFGGSEMDPVPQTSG